MLSFNNCTFAGNLTRDPETIGQNGSAKFGLAVNDGYGDKKTVTYIDVICFKQTAEYVLNNLKKGANVFVNGSLSMNTWEKDGEKRYSFSIKGWTVQGAGKPTGTGGESTQSSAGVEEQPTTENSGVDEDVPF